ncbi:MAG: ATPase, partial [Ruminococcaceae bacterium]|nr:ATPase [Oscillospiraceae bacterium]
MTDSQKKLLASLETDTTTGLSAVEAAERLAQDGPNELAQKKKKTMLVRFLEQFKDVMIIILLIAAAVSFAVAIKEGKPKEFFEPILILLIVVLNAVIGVAQESKAEKALEALQNMSSPHARVIRDGKEQVIDSSALVRGDVVLLEAGDFVPADAMLISSASLKCEEAALTGESVPSEKDADAEVPEGAPLGDRVNMVYSGCSVTYGRGVAVVTATGMSTEMGKIAGLLNEEKETATPLQLKLAQMGKYLGFVALAACAVVFVVDYLINKNELLETFMTAVSLAVSAIPEGLPAIVTVVLSIGVQRMVKRNAIIRSLPAVETLGSASIICSDKTGTLTQNKMTLVRAYSDETGEDSEITDSNSDAIRKLLRCGALCCDGSVLFNIDGSETHIGDPTETSIVLAAHK